MTGYLLDTNVISELKRARPDDRVSAFIAGEPLDRLYLSVVTFAEIRFGIELLADAGRRSDLKNWLDNKLRPMFDGRVLPITEDILLGWLHVFTSRCAHRRIRRALRPDRCDAKCPRLRPSGRGCDRSLGRSEDQAVIVDYHLGRFGQH